MLRRFCILVFVLVLSGSAWSAQRFLKIETEELMHNGLHGAFRCLSTARFFSGTHPMLTTKAVIPSHKSKRNLFRAITPTKKPSFHRLPKEYFIEDRRNVTVERINDRMLLVRHKDHKGKLKNPGVKKAHSILEKRELADNYKEWREKFGPSYADNIVQEAAAAQEEALEKVARNLLKDGMSVDAIARNTGLSEEQIKKLAA